MKQAAIEVVDVTRQFGDVLALKGISLSIDEGEFFSLLGPSGCGKTTLLRMIAGLDAPTSGKIVIGGKDMSKVPAHKRPVNMVFQSYALFPHMNVFDNVAFGLKITGKCTGVEIQQRVTQALELVRLPHVMKRFPRELSGGQQQRIAFARAIVNKPLVLSALDPRIRAEMQTELARFKRELGITFVMVTHDQSEAFALSDRIAVFNAGDLEQLDTPERIYEYPRSAFVADFIGRTNVLSGTVTAIHADRVSVAINENLKLTGVADPQMDPLQAGDQVVVWIRTHSVDLSGEDGAQADDDCNRLAARIVHRSYQGDASAFVLDAEGLQLVALIGETTNGTAPAVGDSVTLKIEALSTHILK